jgi:mRNA interferase MazF
VVRVPFPYTDRDTRQHRPAVVVSNGAVGDQEGLLVVAMVTSARNRPWPGDITIHDYGAAGLPKPSVIRPCKITTLELRDAGHLGRLPDSLVAEVLDAIVALLGRRSKENGPGVAPGPAA